MMAKKTRTAAAPCHHRLPDEINEDIFARMPAKSVLRCRCLSRAWAATLSSDAFVDKHLDLANRRHREVLPRLCLLPDSAAASTVYAWSPPELGEEGAFTPLMHVPRNTRNGALAAETRPCRGVILLLSVAARRYYLCNPSVGQIAALPDGRMAGRPLPWLDYASYGLGYDARARAHKVVRLLYHDGRPAGCDVYDVGAAATGHWRPAATGALPPERVRMNQAGVFAHGHVHWITMEDGRVGGQAIVSFSVAAEEFGYVAPPPRTDVDDAIRLTELAGCLGLVSSPTFPEMPINKYISIWLLTGYAAGSWEKHWHIDLTKLPPAPPEVGDDFLSKGVEPLALVDGGRRIVFMSDEYQVATYSLAAGTLEEAVPALYPHDVRGAARLLLLAPYEESLVPAGPPFEDALASPPAARALSVALRRLPARELGRLKPVCRSWRAMIESDRFVAAHNARAREEAAAASPASVIFLNRYGGGVVSLESCSGDLPVAGRQAPPLSTSRLVCRKPCHGLVLVETQPYYHTLCNPVTREMRSFRLPGQGYGSPGLGYDPSREEHVVVCLGYTRLCLVTGEYAMECEVWPLRDLHPRTLAYPPPIPVAVYLPPVHVGGKMYWPGTAASGAVLAFDISTETFEVVPAPPILLDADGGDRMILAELAGKLCAVHLCVSTETMTVWSKSAEGWRREHIMELGQWPEFSPRTTELVMPMAVDPTDGRVLLDTGKALGYYDTRSRSLETVYSLKSQQIGDGDNGDDMFFIATVCEDSLLRPYDRMDRVW